MTKVRAANDSRETSTAITSPPFAPKRFSGLDFSIISITVAAKGDAEPGSDPETWIAVHALSRFLQLFAPPLPPKPLKSLLSSSNDAFGSRVFRKKIRGHLSPSFLAVR
jgi:hypothetical protein